MSSSDGVLILRTLVGANVQFVVLGPSDGSSALRLVVSRHPTNLEALGRALDSLGSSLRTGPEEPAPGFHRIGDPSGTVSVRTAAGDVDLLFGGPHGSLYAETLERAEERDIGGTRVQWSEAPPPTRYPGRVTSGMLGRRLLSIADELAQMMERRGDRPPPADTVTGKESKTIGGRPPSGQSQRGGGPESNEEPGTSD